ncbi:MAG: carboxypeptidase T [Parcubacteria group bacterium Gr01-1014_72]|nr:MAG: carboxypeptidase T [Parcubacteria group bacterium Gr01-1014_72]
MRTIALLFLLLLSPAFVAAESVLVSEVMYDLSGADTGREWIEIENRSGSAIDVGGWKFFEGNTNHGLTITKGEPVLPVHGVAVIADNSEKFLLDWPAFAGTLFDSTFSLSNEGEALALKNGDELVDSVSYSSLSGAAGDGLSLHRAGETFQAKQASPGSVNTESPPPEAGGGNTDAGDASTTPAAPAGETPPQNSPPSGGGVPLGAQGITARAYGPASATVGADALFTGEAFGLEKKPIQGARFLWVFGDGSRAEGKQVFHAFLYPGRYIVILEASSAEYVAPSRLVVNALAPDIALSGVTSAPRGGVVIENRSSHELDLSFWRLSDGASFFTIPKNTLLLPKSSITFAAVHTALSPTEETARLLYPNGMEAARFKRAGVFVTMPSANPNPNPDTDSPEQTSPPSPAVAHPSGAPPSAVLPRVSNLPQTAAATRAVEKGSEVSLPAEVTIGTGALGEASRGSGATPLYVGAALAITLLGAAVYVLLKRSEAAKEEIADEGEDIRILEDQ